VTLKELSSFRGRIPRSTFVGGSLLACAALAIASELLDRALPSGALLAVSLPFYWVLLALAVKRLHDRGKSAGWLLLALVPLLGAAWLLFEMVFMPGMSGENRHGADPLAQAGDYLVVS
jgi:uncharacterized membrane protein YhaH (DUF805 family)